MPFIPKHLTQDQTEAIYRELLRALEAQELRQWLARVVDPADGRDLEEAGRVREAVEADLEKSRVLWASLGPPEE